MATGGEHVAAAAGEETPLRKPEEQGADTTELGAPSGWAKKVCARFPSPLASFGPQQIRSTWFAERKSELEFEGLWLGARRGDFA